MPALQHQDLILRPFEDDDAPAFASAARESVASVGRWMPWCRADFSTQDALDWFASCRVGLADGSAQEFGVFSTAEGILLGGAGLNKIDHRHRFCNLGYWVRESRQRRGVALGCVQALAAHGFGELGLQRIEIVVAQGNRASEGVARKAGARFEALAGNRLHLHGVSVPASVFALLPPPAEPADIPRYHALGPRLATGGQPSEAQLAALAAAGFEQIINLARHDDPRYSLPNEAATVALLGMDYVHIPVQFAAPLPSDLERFFAAMDGAAARKLFVHCAHNKRVPVFVALYRIARQGWQPDAALAAMREVWQPDEVWSAFIAQALARS